MAKVLTVAAVEKAKPGKNEKGEIVRREVPDAQVPGLYLVIQPSGRKSWAVRTRVHGRPSKITLKALALGAARDEARGIIELARQGKDPRTVAADQEAARPVTFAELADQYISRYAKPRKRTWAEDQADLEHLKKTWGQRTAASISRRDVLTVIEAKAKAAPIRANRLLALLKKAFNWGTGVDLIPASPVTGIKPPAKERSRDRVLSDTELASFWRATEQMGAPWCGLFRVLALSLQRLSEVAYMTRDELDGPLWTLASVRTKAGRPHDVPLAPDALAIIDGAPEIVDANGKASPLVFTVSGKPLSSFSAAKHRLDDLMKAELGDDFKAWRLHDLRRTGASYLASRAVPVPVVSALLNHSPGAAQGVTAIYNRYSYSEERRRALEAWANHVLGLVAPRATNVVAIRA